MHDYLGKIILMAKKRCPDAKQDIHRLIDIKERWNRGHEYSQYDKEEVKIVVKLLLDKMAPVISN